MENKDLYIYNRLIDTNPREVNARYETEDTLALAIKSGNPKILYDFLGKHGAHTEIRRIENDNLRDRKNGLVIRKTLFRIAAREAGVPPTHLHVLSEYHAHIIEKEVNIQHLTNNIADTMFQDFCKAVRDYAANQYSSLVKEAVLYIDANIMENFNLTDVAESLHVHPTYLSHRFKKETGQRMTHYINTQKINLAILLFQSGETNITNVALKCGYTTSSYFSKVFHKKMGIYPRTFIQGLK